MPKQAGFKVKPLDILKELKGFARPAIIANSEKQAQDLSKPMSGYGGVFWGTSDEEWPVYKDRHMTAALSLRVDELPSIPAHLDGVALLNIFIDRRAHPEEDEGAMAIRTYDNLEGLRPLDIPDNVKAGFHKITWQPVVDYPDGTLLEYKLAWTEIEKDLDDCERRRAIEDQFHEQFEKHYDEIQKTYPDNNGIKIGGWPTSRQVSPVAFLADDDPGYLLQLDFTDVYTFYDGGIGYLLKWDGKFVMSGWTC